MKSPLITKRSHIRAIGNRRVIADGLEHGFWGDFYHNAMVMSWPVFFGSLFAVFLALNLFFAALFWLGEAPIANAKAGHFSDLFFFSAETFFTVGYGDMHPQSMYAHLLATGENFVGTVLLAVMTGLVFSRFSRPRARLIYARNPVIMTHEGKPTLIFRVANARNSFMTEATAKLWMLGPSVTAEGRRFVGFQPLPLLKSENPTFALSWTLFHTLDGNSPLAGLTDDELAASEINLVLSINGLDETSAQMVYSRNVFAAQDIKMGHEFVDLFSFDENGERHINYAMVHETRPQAIAPST